MNLPINPFKKALAQGPARIGLWLGMADARNGQSPRRFTPESGA